MSSHSRHASETSEHGQDGNPAVESNMSRDIINIPDNVLLTGIAGYTDEQQDLIQFAVSYGRSELGNSRDKLCQAIGCDWSTFIRICTGKYEASVDSFCDKLAEFQKRATDIVDSGFVDTIVTRRISEMLDYALDGDMDGGRIVMIVGPTGGSKTETVKRWCKQNNHGRSIYVDCPESGGLKALFKEIAVKVGVNGQRSTTDMRERLIKSFNRRRILVLDEVARLLPSRRVERIPQQLEFIRRLHDVRKCAVALIATPIFEHEMTNGWLPHYMEQLLGRCDPLVLPMEPRMDEIVAICNAFTKERPSRDLITLAKRIAGEKGRFRVLFDLLRKASVAARKKGEPLDARHLDAAWKRRMNLSVWPEEKGE